MAFLIVSSDLWVDHTYRGVQSFRIYATSCTVEPASTGVAMQPFIHTEKKAYIHPTLFSPKITTLLSLPDCRNVE